MERSSTENPKESIAAATVRGDSGELGRAFNEEPDGGYMLAKRMADGAVRLYDVRVNLAPPLGGAND